MTLIEFRKEIDKLIKEGNGNKPIYLKTLDGAYLEPELYLEDAFVKVC